MRVRDPSSPAIFVLPALAVLLVFLLFALGGCGGARTTPAPSGPPIVLTPLAPSVAPAVAPPAVSRALKRDTAAVRARARAFIAPPSTPMEAVVTLDPLTRAMNRSLAVMELHHTPRGYRPADVRAARAAADAVAAFLNAQPPPATLVEPTR